MRNTVDAEVVSGGDTAFNLLGIHDDFGRFRSENALLKAHLPRSDVNWEYYQAGPTSDADPIVFLHGTSGTAATFFYQVKILSEKGYRIISAQYPAYNSPEDWCKGFDHFLDMLRCRSVHIFGAGLGGYLAQHFAARFPQRVRSLILCNAFASTRSFADKAGALASVVHITPTPILRKVMLDSFPQVPMTLQAKQAVDFVASQVNEISGTDLAGRLSLNSTESSAAQVTLDVDRMTIIESSGETMVPEELRRDLRRRYPSARVAELKSAGDFPFLSRPEEVALFIEVHMRGMGIFAGGLAPCAAAVADDSVAVARRERPGTTREGSGHWAPTPQPKVEEVAQPAAPPVVRRPKWINPFEDDPLL